MKQERIEFSKYSKNITQTNINKAFFDMNGQISIILMLTFTISTILQ